MSTTAESGKAGLPAPRPPSEPSNHERVRGHEEKTRSPWIKDHPAFWVAALALAVSVFALYVSQQNHDQDQLSLDRQRLTSLEDSVSQVLQGVPEGNSVGVFTTRPYMNEAFILIKRLDGSPLEATPYERIRIANLFMNASEPLTAIDLSAAAEKQAERLTLTEKVDSAKALGAAQFVANRSGDGRASFDRALGYLLDSSLGHDVVSLTRMRLEVQQLWADNEMRANDCDAAATHVRAARAEVDGMAKWGQLHYDDRAVDVAKRYIDTCGRSALTG